MQLRPVRLLALACATAVTMVGISGAPAHADGATGGSGNGGFTTSVSATISGDAGDPLTGGGGGSTISISVPPKCWWTPWDTSNLSFYDIDPNDPRAMEKYFEETVKDTTISFVPSRLMHPTSAYLAGHRGSQWTWYSLQAADGVNCADEGFAEPGGQGPQGWEIGGSNTLPISYAAFLPGEEPPVLVDVEDVVDVVWEQATAEVDPADLDRNPKIGDVGGASLVNMATWFWVQNVQEALANDGEINLRVDIPAASDPTWAELNARTEGVQVTSPAGAANCTVEQAKTEYSAGASEAGACTFPFDRANTAGWPVTSAINWTGTWQGMDSSGPDGGPLTPINQSSTINVPVAESQALVNDVD